MFGDFEIKFNDNFLCTELTSGEKYSGKFQFGDDGISTTLVSFDGPILVKLESPIILITEKLDVISLYDSFTGHRGKTFRNDRPAKTAHTQKIVSNIAVVGNDEWAADNRVKRVGFGIRNTMPLLRNQEKVARLSMARVQGADEKDDWLLLNFKANGMAVRLYYTAQYGQWSNEPREVEPRFELEFDEAVLLGKHLDPVRQVVAFCSMALGVPLIPSNITISRQSLVEFLDDVNNRRPTQDHRLLYRWFEFEIDPSEIRMFGSPVNAYNQNGLDNLGECLRVWLERGAEWRDAYELMIGAFVRRNEFGADRLLNACKWFEALPNSRANQVVDTETIQAISIAAIEAARERGIKGIKDRISGSIRSIGQENRDQLFRRLIDLAWHAVPLPHPLNEMVSDLKSSQKLRGKAAHGNLDLDDKDGDERIMRCTDALEALCILMTLRDLPITDDCRQQVNKHRIVDRYCQWASSEGLCAELL